MQIHPTRSAIDLAVGGMLTVTLGLVVQQPAVLAWGSALLLGLAIARAVTLVGVARIRAAGFEMLWRGHRRLVRAGRGEVVELEAEVRNRDSRAARYVALRAIASPLLDVTLDPKEGEVPAGGRLLVSVKITASRVGRHGVHGLSLEVQGSPGLFEVPLTFANPAGIEVMPRSWASLRRSARGGRSRMTADAGRPGPLSGDGYELRELREHQAGDPFKKIAWKASARRGTLLVRDHELEERDVVWLLLDASVELWSGAPGEAPLDRAIDEVASVAGRHLARGDRVGLGVLGARTLAWLPPDGGVAHLAKIHDALISSTATLDHDRSDLDDADVALRVFEHLRPLDPAATARVRPTELERLARRAEKATQRAPFPPLDVKGVGREDEVLRRYLSAFGLGSPARTEPDRPKTDRTLAAALAKVVKERPRASVAYVWSPLPDLATRASLDAALSSFPRRRLDLRWVPMVERPEASVSASPMAAVVSAAMNERLRVAGARGTRALRRLGISIDRLPRRSPASAARSASIAPPPPGDRESPAA